MIAGILLAILLSEYMEVHMICHGRLFCSLGFLLLLSACGANNHSGGSSFPVDIYSDNAVASSASTAADFQTALTFWEQKAGRKLFNYKGVWSQGAPYTGTADNPTGATANVLFFQNPWPFAANIAGKTTVFSQGPEIQGAIVMINPSIPLCAGDCTSSPGSNSQRKDFAHELGHFLGLNHIEDINDIMYPILQTGGVLDGVNVDMPSLLQLTNPT